MTQYEYLFAFPNNIDACLATEFDECVSFYKAGPTTSANIAMAAVGDEVTVTHDPGASCKWICKEVQTSGYKCFAKKHPGKGYNPVVVARPIGMTDVVLSFVSRNVAKKTWKLLAENKNGDKQVLVFADSCNINEVKVAVKGKFSRGWNDECNIEVFGDVNGRSNALKFFCPGITKSVKARPVKRPAAQKKIVHWAKK